MTEKGNFIDMSDPVQREAYISSIFEGYRQNSRLSMDLMMYSILRPETPSAAYVRRDTDIVDKAKEALETEVWFDGGLQRQIQNSPERGLSVENDDFSALVYSIAGRTMITLSDKEKGIQVTLITGDDEPRQENGKGRMGIQSVDATAEDAVALINKARLLQRDGLFSVSPNPNVGILF